MKSKARKYTFRLYPGDMRHADCIYKLDEILKKIINGEVRKGTLSQEIGKALIEYFRVNREATEHTKSSECIYKQGLSETECKEQEYFTDIEPTDTSKDAESIKSALMHLSMSLLE